MLRAGPAAVVRNAVRHHHALGEAPAGVNKHADWRVKTVSDFRKRRRYDFLYSHSLKKDVFYEGGADDDFMGLSGFPDANLTNNYY